MTQELGLKGTFFGRRTLSRKLNLPAQDHRQSD
jgi:hypothetical protein